MRLSSQVASITGGASGFGACVAETCVAPGAKVVLADLNAELGEKVAAGLRAGGHDAHFGSRPGLSGYNGSNGTVFLADPAPEFMTGVCREVVGGRCI